MILSLFSNIPLQVSGVEYYQKAYNPVNLYITWHASSLAIYVCKFDVGGHNYLDDSGSPLLRRSIISLIV